MEPSRFEAPGTVTHLVRSSMSSITFFGRQLSRGRIERRQHVLAPRQLRRRVATA